MIRGFIELFRIYIFLVAGAGFIFGQIYSGNFGSVATIIGISGIVVGIFSSARYDLKKSSNIVIIIGCITGLLGVSLDAYHSKAAIRSGNYAWFMIIPFCVCLALLAIRALWRLCRKP